MSRRRELVSPEVSMVMPRLFCEGEERFGGFFGDQGQVDAFWREGAPIGAAEQEQRLRDVDRPGVDRVEPVDELAVSPSGSLRATSRRVWVIASGVRSSWEAFAANLCCSATCASSCASMASKASASSRNSSLRPGSRIRWESDPVAAMRVASVIRPKGASIRPARSHPPTRPNTTRNAPEMAAAGAKSRKSAPRLGDTKTCALMNDDRLASRHISQEERPHHDEE